MTFRATITVEFELPAQAYDSAWIAHYTKLEEDSARQDLAEFLSRFDEDEVTVRVEYVHP